MAEFNEPIEDDVAEEKPRIRRTRKEPTPTGKATVRETKVISYSADLPPEEEPEEKPSAPPIRERFIPIGHRGFRPFAPESHPKNTISHFFDVLAQEEAEAFLLFVTRLPDMPSERFYIPQALYPANFPVVQISKYDAPNFVQMLVQLNGNSGGRFSIRACHLDGEAIDDAVLQNFVVPNPQRDEPAITGISDKQELIAFFQQVMQQQEQRFAELLKQMQTSKQDSEFDTLAKDLLRKKLLDPAPEQERFNPERFMEQLMTSQVVMETIASSFANRFNSDNKDDDKPTWLQLMESDTGKLLVERASNIANSLAVLGAQRMAQNSQTVSNTTPNPQQPEPHQTTAQEQTRMAIDTTKLTSYIIDELESDNPIDGNNEVLQELKDDYPQPFMMLTQLAKAQPFEQLLSLLNTFVPEAFIDLQDEKGELTEKGKKIQQRLLELYNYLQTVD